MTCASSCTTMGPASLPRCRTCSTCSCRASAHSIARRAAMGIGLSLVKRLVEMHGGVVSASSEGAGTGATFTLRLPRVAGPAAMPAPAVAAAGRPRRILVVDDNVDAADSLAMLLRLDGHEVDTAYGAEGALAAVAARPPEIMLLDIGLPMMDGYEVARRARALPEGAGVRFIALTGYGQGEDRELALAAGFEHHLVKPPDLETLQRLLQS
ncbi:MAG: response regulator [Steroidobacteraceae bacterium]